MWLLKHSPEKGVGIPRVHYYGSQCGKNFLAMDLLGKSLESCLEETGGSFGAFTVASIAVQTI